MTGSDNPRQTTEYKEQNVLCQIILQKKPWKTLWKSPECHGRNFPALSSLCEYTANLGSGSQEKVLPNRSATLLWVTCARLVWRGTPYFFASVHFKRVKLMLYVSVHSRGFKLIVGCRFSSVRRRWGLVGPCRRRATNRRL